MSRVGKRRKLPRKEDEPASARADIPAIADVDTDIGVLNAGGNPQVYREILSDFCREAETREERLRRAAREGNAALCIILLYAIKDASAGIGAVDLARRAMQLADAAKNGDLPDMREGTEALLRNKRLLTECIRAALKQAAQENQYSVIDLSHFCMRLPKIARDRARPK
jgi:HPt (histidine-containing phosphotransfer) domain-containing protein